MAELRAACAAGQELARVDAVVTTLCLLLEGKLKRSALIFRPDDDGSYTPAYERLIDEHLQFRTWRKEFARTFLQRPDLLAKAEVVSCAFISRLGVVAALAPDKFRALTGCDADPPDVQPGAQKAWEEAAAASVRSRAPKLFPCSAPLHDGRPCQAQPHWSAEDGFCSYGTCHLHRALCFASRAPMVCPLKRLGDVWGVGRHGNRRLMDLDDMDDALAQAEGYASGEEREEGLPAGMREVVELDAAPAAAAAAAAAAATVAAAAASAALPAGATGLPPSPPPPPPPPGAAAAPAAAPVAAARACRSAPAARARARSSERSAGGAAGLARATGCGANAACGRHGGRER